MSTDSPPIYVPNDRDEDDDSTDPVGPPNSGVSDSSVSSVPILGDRLASGGAGLIGRTFRIGRKTVTTVVSLGLLAVLMSEGYALYEINKSGQQETYFAFDWTGEYDDDNQQFIISSPIFVENSGMLNKIVKIDVMIILVCGENESVSQSNQEYELGVQATLVFKSDLTEQITECIESDTEFTVELTGNLSLTVFGYDVMENVMPEIELKCSYGQGDDDIAETVRVNDNSCRKNE